MARTRKAKPGPSRPSRPSTRSTDAKPNATDSSKRERATVHSNAAQPPPKRIRAAQSQASKPSKPTKDNGPPLPPTSHPVINRVPKESLTIFAFGEGDSGQLGLGPQKNGATRPSLNKSFKPADPSGFAIVQLACGGMHSVALTDDNRIVTWGVNDEYALGRDTEWTGGMRDLDAESDSDSDDAELNPLESTPTAIPSNAFPPSTRFVQVAAGDSCSFALTDTGFVYGWGTFRDSKGDKKFGYGSSGEVISKQRTPALVELDAKITHIACGGNHALALDTGGSVWAWGSNDQNQFGRRLFGRHQDSYRPQRARICRGGVKYIASGEFHSFAVDQKDNVWGWGLNSYGQAGDAASAGGDAACLPYPVKIRELCGRGVSVLDGGSHHSVAVTASGECLTWGRLDPGALGIAFTDGELRDKALIRTDEWNKPRICLRPTPVPNLGPVVEVACGSEHTLFVTRAGAAYAAGFAYQGQLGLGDTDDVTAARRIEARVVKDRVLTRAWAGGNFSMLGSVEIAIPP